MHAYVRTRPCSAHRSHTACGQRGPMYVLSKFELSPRGRASMTSFRLLISLRRLPENLDTSACRARAARVRSAHDTIPEAARMNPARSRSAPVKPGVHHEPRHCLEDTRSDTSRLFAPREVQHLRGAARISEQYACGQHERKRTAHARLHAQVGLGVGLDSQRDLNDLKHADTSHRCAGGRRLPGRRGRPAAEGVSTARKGAHGRCKSFRLPPRQRRSPERPRPRV